MKFFLVILCLLVSIGSAFGATAPETIPIDILKTVSIPIYREYLRSLTETYGEYNYETLKRHPEIVDAILKVKSTFKKNDIGTAFPNGFFKTKEGRILVVLRGCTPHDCAGTVHIIAYDTLSRKAFLLREKYDREAIEIHGAPDALIKQLLINAYLE